MLMAVCSGAPLTPTLITRSEESLARHLATRNIASTLVNVARDSPKRVEMRFGHLRCVSDIARLGGQLCRHKRRQAGSPSAVASGLFYYLLSLAFTRTPEVSVSLPLLGRAVLGGAETFTICEQLSTKPQRAD